MVDRKVKLVPYHNSGTVGHWDIGTKYINLKNNKMETNTNYTMSQVARLINGGLGRNKLLALLKENKIITMDNTPFREYVLKGYFIEYSKTYLTQYYTFKQHSLTLVTEEGLEWLKDWINMKVTAV